jgi:hypothetical protein
MARIVVVIAGGLALAACATAAPDATSWGKPDVTMTDFLVDAATCMSEAANVRASPEPLVQAGVGRVSGDDPGSSEAARASNDALMDQADRLQDSQIRADRRARQAAHDACLVEHGYVKFQLNREQLAHLRSLPEQSAERRAYLHELGADPAVLEAQKL